jgi:hypothetical protein
MKKLLTPILFMCIAFTFKSLGVSAKSQKLLLSTSPYGVADEVKIVENEKYSIKITPFEYQNSRGKSKGDNFVEFVGYSVEELLIELYPMLVTFTNRSAFSKNKYRVRIEIKQKNTPISSDESLMRLLSKHYKYKVQKKAKELEFCSFLVVDIIRWQSAQIKGEDLPEGVMKRNSNGKLYCYSCTLKDVAEFYTSTSGCVFEGENLNRKTSVILQENNIQGDLKAKGVLINRSTKKSQGYSVTFL